MTQNNQESIYELISYRKQAVKIFFILILIIFVLIFIFNYLKINFLLNPLAGILLGVIFSAINMFTLGYAYYMLVLKKYSYNIIWAPVMSFLLMCLVGFILVFNFDSLIFGYAIGITAPILFGAKIIMSTGPKPA